MSRRAPGPSDRSEQNRLTLKALVKLESNKSCADCKRNKHPRWASWNIGVFVCIRCSGIHRGMGTHISRVKSVDLDSWTDEQMQNMIRWGNARANKYWEDKLAEGHMPNESKIENFIRTKYDSRRWAMDGPMPDPSSLDDGAVDDDVPLNVVREQVVERVRAGSLRNGSGSGAALPQPPKPRPAPAIDLFGDAEESVPARPSTTEPAVRSSGLQKAPAAPPKQTKPGESLLGLDFFGGTSSAPPARPSSTGPTTPGVPGRADLKSSILSLYASKPAAAPQPQVHVQQPQVHVQQPQNSMNAFAGMSAPPLTSPTQQQHPSNQQGSFGGMNDAFSSLSFTSPQQSQPKPTAFSNLTSPTGQTRQAPPALKPALSGGSFFDTKPAPPPRQSVASPPPVPSFPAARKESFGNEWGDFSSGASPITNTNSKSPPLATSSMGDLFGFGGPPPPSSKPAAPAPTPPRAPAQPPPINSSAFNLSQPMQLSAPPKPVAPAASNFSSISAMSNADAWGSNDAWASPDPPASTKQPSAPPLQTSTVTMNTIKPAPPAPQPTMSAFDTEGWGDTTSSKTGNVANAANASSAGFNVQQDEEFGGWSHASPVANSASQSKPSGGGFGSGAGTDDLFGNVWE